MKINKLLLNLFLISLVFVSCSDDPDPVVAPTPEPSKGNFEGGIIVSAEGNFGNKDGSVSFVGSNLNSLATNFIYTGVNNAQLGGLIQSIAFNEDEAYIILNDVNTIVVVDRYTFEKKAEIKGKVDPTTKKKTGLNNPRYMAFANGKGYVTNWGEGGDKTDDFLAVVDLKTKKLLESKQISLDNGVERIISKNNKLYVTHLGAWSSNNIVSVVDLGASNAVTKITVKDNPDEIFVDNSGNLVVLSEGKPTYGGAPDYAVISNTTSAISFINASTNKVTREIVFPENQRATLLSYDNGKIYYYKGADKKVYEIAETAKSLATSGIDVGRIYGMSAKDNNIYAVEYAFTKLSKLTIYDASKGKSKYSSVVGLGASKIYFN